MYILDGNDGNNGHLNLLVLLISHLNLLLMGNLNIHKPQVYNLVSVVSYCERQAYRKYLVYMLMIQTDLREKMESQKLPIWAEIELKAREIYSSRDKTGNAS